MQDDDSEGSIALAQGDLDAAGLNEPEDALLRFAETVTKHAHRVTDEAVERLRQLGWSDPQIAEAVYITALFAFFNRVADAFGLKDPNYFGTLGAAGRDTPAPPSSDEEVHDQGN